MHSPSMKKMLQYKTIIKMIINKLSGISNPLSLERLMPGTTFLRKTRREELTGTKKKGKKLGKSIDGPRRSESFSNFPSI